ncbi:MAG: hypothetical protein H8E61_07435 [Bacteroidetes bacterium]|nr:hypothetical protein [Bacteroidota bacterium]
MMKNLFLTLILIFGLSLTSHNQSFVSDGGEWTSSRDFDVTLYGNNFHTVILTSYPSYPCEVHVKVKFYAPNNEYYRFQLKVTLESGAWLRSEVFYNSTWGEREFTWSYNTDSQGCWGQSYQAPSYLNVHGCEGYDCPVRGFD